MEPAALINKPIIWPDVSLRTHCSVHPKYPSLLLLLSFRHSKYELTGGIKMISIAQPLADAAFREIQWRDRL